MQTEKIVDHIVAWIDTRFQDASTLSGLVVGVSGGIDSALTSTLCALTGKPVRAFTLPIHQRAAEVKRAEKHLAWLTDKHPNVQAGNIDLTETFEQLKQALPEDSRGDLALANSRSRLRMVALYAVSSTHRMLVCGTGNRVEDFGIGFFTKYGDGGVDISPIAGLMKTEVYRLAEHLGVGEDILSAPPTDGLWADGRNDEEQIGATYKELEWAMEFDGDVAALQDRQAEVYHLYNHLNTINAHKMHPIPVCHIPADLRTESST